MWIIFLIFLMGCTVVVALPFAILAECLRDPYEDEWETIQWKEEAAELMRKHNEFQRKIRSKNVDARSVHLHIENPNDKEQKNDSRAQEEKGTHIV